MPKKNGKPTKAELRKQEKQKEEEATKEKWEEPEDAVKYPPKYFDHCGVGPKNVSHVLSPLEIFMLFWGSFLPEVAKGLDEYVNRPTVRSIGLSHKKKEDTSITVTVLLAWIALYIAMGVCHQPGVRDHWNKGFGTPFVKESQFTREFFNNIFTAQFHLHEELDTMERDLNNNFRQYWTPFQRNAIDEIMRKFKGHWKKGKVYSPDKPTKWGLKYYAMVDAAQYLFWFRLYKRVGEQEKEDMTDSERAMYEGSITRNLCNDAIDKLQADMGCYKIYADNYYGGMELAEDINKQDFGFTLCCKANRPAWLFKNWLDQERAMHSINGLDNFACRINKENGIAAISWKDKANVRYLTNQHANESTQVYRKTHFSNVKSLETVPAAAADYTKQGMGHVDSFDKHLVTCAFDYKNSCWRRTHFLTMLKMTLVNCWRFYIVQQATMSEEKAITQKEFLQVQLLEPWNHDLEQAQLAMDLKRKAQNREAQQQKRAKRNNEGIPKALVTTFPAQNREHLYQQYIQTV